MWYNVIGEYANAVESEAAYPVPEKGIIEAHVCTNTGLIAGKNCPKGEIGYWKEDNAPVCPGCKNHDATGATTESGGEVIPNGTHPVITPVNPVDSEVTPVNPDPGEPVNPDPVEPDPITPPPPAPIDDGGDA
jgi:hypothetical protein